MHFTYFDFGVFAILFISTALSFFRGIVREMLSLGSWFGAGVVALYMFPRVAKVLEHYVHNQTLASGFAALLTFTLALVAISMAGSVLLKFMKEGSDVGLLDHGMGLLFGFARGALVVAIGYFIFSLGVAQKDFPDMIKKAYTRPYVAQAAVVVAKIAPGYLDELAGTNTKVAVERANNIAPAAGGKTSTPAKQVEEDVKTDTQASDTKASTNNWPTTDDLKQRIQGVKKDE